LPGNLLLVGMRLSPTFSRRLRWMNLPTGVLLALLQRTPVANVVQLADEAMASSPLGAILKSALAATAAFGALDTLAGATTLSTNIASPENATVNSAIQPVAFSVIGTASPAGSWQLTSTLPAGLTLIDPSTGGATLTAPGLLNTANPVLTGTPTAAGTFKITLVAWEFVNGTGVESPTYTYTLVIAANANAPAFSTEPQATVVNVGTSVTLTAAASGSPAYQWRKNGTAISGATSASFTIASPATTDTGTYDVVASNSSGSTASVAVSLTVVSPTAAPTFTVQPLPQSANQGVGVSFNATAVGAGTITYQWFKGTSQITGQTSASLALTNVQMGDQASYYVAATNANGTTNSSTVALTVSVPAGPVITVQPVSVTVAPGGSVSFSVTASNALNYQWYFNGSKIAGAIAATYSIPSVTNSAQGSYYVVVDNIVTMMDIYGDSSSTGAATNSNNANLIIASVAAPAFTTQPASQTVNAGATVTFTAAASGSPTYQWQKNQTNISGATNATYTITSAATTDSGNYTVLAMNGGGTVSSTTASLTVNAAAAAPSFTTQPTPQTIAPGTTVVFSAAATGATSYQWNLNTSPISGATSPRLLIANATSANAGNYTLTATNGSGPTTSSPAALAVTSTTAPGHLVNLSILSNITGSLTMGFVNGGTGTSGAEPLLIRADGPSLGAPPFNFPGILPDPTLQLVQQTGSITLATNAGWGTPASNITLVQTADAATGAFALVSTASLDSALVENLPSVGGGYSVVVSGKTGDGGNAITEVYDATSNYTATSTRLINLSCITTIPAGGALGVGFVLGGTTNKTLLVRVSGPTLASFGEGGTMTDPQMVVTPQSNGAIIIASNSGWNGDPVISAVAASIGAFAFTSLTSHDSAVVLTLPPGVPYTVEVSSASGGGGAVLVEIYEVP